MSAGDTVGVIIDFHLGKLIFDVWGAKGSKKTCLEVFNLSVNPKKDVYIPVEGVEADSRGEYVVSEENPTFDLMTSPKGVGYAKKVTGEGPCF